MYRVKWRDGRIQHERPSRLEIAKIWWGKSVQLGRVRTAPRPLEQWTDARKGLQQIALNKDQVHYKGVGFLARTYGTPPHFTPQSQIDG